MDDRYGIDVDAPVPAPEGDVVVPEVALVLSSEKLTQLKRTVDPPTASDEFGIDLYEQAFQFMTSLQRST